MRVVVLGGYGVFGGRLARLLLRDGHNVWVAGRDIRKAERFTAQYGGQPLRIDLTASLAPLQTAEADVVVDAAGPFNRYAAPAHRVAAFCIENGISYLDLSDDGRFTAGIAELDERATAAGVFALSGASSVPGISSAVVRDLEADFDRIDAIESVIVPGNRAPRGRSVVTGILARAGGVMQLWRGGQWRDTRCWSGPRRYVIGAKLKRRAWLIDVPDTLLFPEWTRARSVIFRAGMELGLLNRAVSLAARLRRWGLPTGSRAFGALAHRVAALLKPFGTDRGGMVVMVTGRRCGDRLPTTRRWDLLVGAGDGPFIPTTVVRALLRAAGTIAPGARPCLAEVTLEEINAAMSDIDATATTSETAAPFLFQAALGDIWNDLPATLQRLHEVTDLESATGRATVERGGGLMARLAALMFRFPKSTADIPVTVTMTRTHGSRGQDSETWVRDFGGRRFRSHLSGGRRGYVRERFGALSFEIALLLGEDGLRFDIRRGWCLGIPMPRFLMPGVDTREYEEDGRFHFDVGLAAPITHALIVRYRGWLEPDG